MKTNSWKQNLRTELDKMKVMSRQDRLWYLWEYYKLHLGAILLVIGLAVLVGQTIYRSTYQTYLSCVYVTPNVFTTDLSLTPLTDDFHTYMNLSEKQLITGEHLSLSFTDQMSEMDYISMAKLTALISAKDLDIMIANTDLIQNYATLDGLVSLEQALTADAFEALRPYLVYQTDASGQPQPFALDISQTDFAKESRLPTAMCYLSIIGNTTHIDQCLLLIEYIFQP